MRVRRLEPRGQPRFAAAAKDLARELAARGIAIAYGGGSVGLMGILADAGIEAGTEVVGGLWQRGLEESLGPRREQNLTITLREVEHALDAHPRRDALLDEFHEHGSIRPTDDGAFVAVSTY